MVVPQSLQENWRRKFFVFETSSAKRRGREWSIDCLVVTKNMVVQTEKDPYLVFVGLRGTRPYAPSRNLRQLGGKQELSKIADMRKYATEHENRQVAFAVDICRI